MVAPPASPKATRLGDMQNKSGDGSPRSNHLVRNQVRNQKTNAFALAVMLASAFAAGPAMASGDLVLIPDPKVLGILIVAFAILIFPLNALLFKPIFTALDARAERIQGARERSGQIQEEADAVLTRYESAIRQARSEAETQRQAQRERARDEQAELTAAARQEAEVELERARTELTQSLDEARASLRTNAEGLAEAAASQVLGRALS